MDRPMMLLRLGYYCGVASRLLNDTSHEERVLGRAEQITEADYLEIKAKIETDLVEAGHLINFQPSGRGKAQNPLKPDYPNGIAVDTGQRPACLAALPYPAPECGLYFVFCKKCRVSVAITSVGRPDDPVSVMVPCNEKGAN